MTTTEALHVIIDGKYVTEELNIKCGVYIITINNKHYIGSCKLLENKSSRNGFHYRLYAHLYLLLKNKHHSSKLQNAFNKYGITKLEYDILDECQPHLSVEIEQYWTNLLDSYRKGYNCRPRAHSNKGIKWSDYSKKRFSEKLKGRISPLKGLKKNPLSEEAKLNLSIKLKGRKKLPMSETQKEKIRITLKGKHLTDEQRQKYLKAKELQKGKNHWSAKKIYQYDLEGNFIREWGYIKEIQEHNPSFKSIYNCLNRKTTHGYRWFCKFLGEKIDPITTQKNQFTKYLLTLS
jgi:group I intron endonuclease